MSAQVKIPEDLMVFNGIDGKTGQYLIPPMSAERLVSVIRGERKDWDSDHFDDLRKREESERLGVYAIEEGRNPTVLAETGWGVVFPAALDESTTGALREALGVLLEHRKKLAKGSYQEGGLYREFSGGDGYRRGESSKQWLNRHNVDLGPANPAKGVPYYLLIVGDPNSIPYVFQYGLDVDRAVGRIFFETLDEYASYARSVVDAENGKVARSPRAVFFGVTNRDDRATELSTEYLIQPLARRLEQAKQDKDLPFVKEIAPWKLETVQGNEASKDRLLQLMGGTQAPALLFTASHGVGFRPGEAEQLDYQGALVCQDWGGPYSGGIQRDHYLAGEDITDGARVVGMIDFHFACFGAGTPYYDDFYRRFNRARSPIAPYAFLAGLPTRLLGHPKGGALAVVGHVERAWTHSFKWSTSDEQTTAFYSTLLALMRGIPVGHALEYINSRYASVSVQLSTTLDNWEYEQDTNLLADLWTGNNDARGYAIIGDPAVRVAVASEEKPAVEQAVIKPVPHRVGSLPPILDPAAKPEAVAAATAAPAPGGAGAAGEVQRFAAAGGEAFVTIPGAEALQSIKDGVAQVLAEFAKELQTFVEGVTTLEVATFVTDDIAGAQYDSANKRFSPGAQQRALTHISLDGDTKIVVPLRAGDLDNVVWTIHKETVAQAQAYRAEVLRVVGEFLNGFLPKIG